MIDGETLDSSLKPTTQRSVSLRVVRHISISEPELNSTFEQITLSSSGLVNMMGWVIGPMYTEKHTVLVSDAMK